MISILAQIEPDFVPDPAGTPVGDGGGSGVTGVVVFAIVLGLAWFLWRRRAGRRSAAALERVAEAVDPSAPAGRYPRPPAVRWERNSIDKIAQAEAFISAVSRRCIGCGRKAGIPGAQRPLLDICASCEGRVILALGDGSERVEL